MVFLPNCRPTSADEHSRDLPKSETPVHIEEWGLNRGTSGLTGHHLRSCEAVKRLDFCEPVKNYGVALSLLGWRA